jgi:hypothetical protein
MHILFLGHMHFFTCVRYFLRSGFVKQFEFPVATFRIYSVSLIYLAHPEEPADKKIPMEKGPNHFRKRTN